MTAEVVHADTDGCRRRVTGVSSSDELTAEARARRSAGRSVRRIGHALVGHQASEELLDDIATTLTGLTARLDAGAARRRPIERVGHRQGATTDRGAAIESYDDRPFSGTASPWGVDLEVHRVGDEIEATVTLGAAHEGAPGAPTAGSSPDCSTTCSVSSSELSRNPRSRAS